VRRDATDYVREVKERARALIERELEGAAVYAGDPEHVPAFGAGGTFCVEAASSGVEAAAGGCGRVVVTLRVWTYVDGDGPEADEAVAALAQRLEAALFAAGTPSAGAGSLGLETEYLRTDYLTREKGRAFRRRRVRAGRTEWRVRLAARR
jgi:hypothetical protein